MSISAETLVIYTGTVTDNEGHSLLIELGGSYSGLGGKRYFVTDVLRVCTNHNDKSPVLLPVLELWAPHAH